MNSGGRIALAITILGSALVFTIQAGAAPNGEPRVSEDAARATALQRVKGGIVQSAELEHEAGKLIWSFDIARPGSKNVTEIWIDANTGRVVSNKKETPAEQAKEAQADKLSK